MPAVVKFKNPPRQSGHGRPRGASRHPAIAEALRGRPGRWALVMEGVASSNATNIKQGTNAAYAPAGDFEATVHKRPDGKYDIYARFVGESR